MLVGLHGVTLRNITRELGNWNQLGCTKTLPFLFLPQFSSKVKQLGVSLKIWENFNSMFGQPSLAPKHQTPSKLLQLR